MIRTEEVTYSIRLEDIFGEYFQEVNIKLFAPAKPEIIIWNARCFRQAGGTTYRECFVVEAIVEN